MVDDPAQYRWSSYRANALGEPGVPLTHHPDYLALGNSRGTRLEAYRGLFEAHLDNATVEKIRRATNGNYVLGNQKFQKQIAAMLKRRVTPGKSGRPRKNKPS